MPIDWNKVGKADVADAPVERRRRSYSQLSSYYQCSWAYYLTRELKLPETPSVWLAGGTAFHSATEEFDLAVWQENDLSKVTGLDYFVERFNPLFDSEIEKRRENDPAIDRTDDKDLKLWRASGSGRPTRMRPFGEDIAWWRVAGKEFVRDYISYRTLTNDTLRIASVEGAPAVEVKVETELGGVPVVGYVDRIVEEVATGTLIVRDMKSGKRMPEETTQLGQYSVQIGQQSGLDVTWGDYYNARKGATTEPYDLTRYTEFGLGEAYRRLDDAVNAGRFEPNVTALCGTCGVKQFCAAKGGAIPNAVSTSEKILEVSK